MEGRVKEVLKAKEKDGIHIEVKTGTLSELLSSFIMGNESKEDKEDFKLYEKIEKIFEKQTLQGQTATIHTLIDKHIELIKDNCCECKKEELKNNVNSKTDS